tara:strand:- start:124 stop:270 length:147 start_codon:yes stop_codon:yes gene_type:complete
MTKKEKQKIQKIIDSMRKAVSSEGHSSLGYKIWLKLSDLQIMIDFPEK